MGEGLWEKGHGRRFVRSVEKVRWRRSVGEGPSEKVRRRRSIGEGLLEKFRRRRSVGEVLSKKVRWKSFVGEGPQEQARHKRWMLMEEGQSKRGLWQEKCADTM